jgi:hypothetical protein
MSDFDEGLRNRRAVLGDAHVERSLARRTAFTRESRPTARTRTA